MHDLGQGPGAEAFAIPLGQVEIVEALVLDAQVAGQAGDQLAPVGQAGAVRQPGTHEQDALAGQQGVLQGLAALRGDGGRHDRGRPQHLPARFDEDLVERRRVGDEGGVHPVQAGQRLQGRFHLQPGREQTPLPVAAPADPEGGHASRPAPSCPAPQLAHRPGQGGPRPAGVSRPGNCPRRRRRPRPRRAAAGCSSAAARSGRRPCSCPHAASATE